MNQMVFVLYSGTIQFWEESDLKLTTFSAFISHLAKYKERNKFITVFLHEIVINFPTIYLSEAPYMIISFHLITVIRVNSRCNNHSMNS